MTAWPLPGCWSVSSTSSVLWEDGGLVWLLPQGLGHHGCLAHAAVRHGGCEEDLVGSTSLLQLGPTLPPHSALNSSAEYPTMTKVSPTTQSASRIPTSGHMRPLDLNHGLPLGSTNGSLTGDQRDTGGGAGFVAPAHWVTEGSPWSLSGSQPPADSPPQRTQGSPFLAIQA